ncbi:MAG: S-adenosylmethionine:tRNA ribosyltransferase-isomerase, partial [Oscillospiraceae bacterium]|nr:S-adenosylmethionine:tRNA ribosyltransferase-isomerase [Oscillospiraceae bacterium]
MLKSDFYYELPQELIAQHPAQPRDHSRLMALNRKTGETAHHMFYELPQLLKSGDLLVVNNSKVIPARIIGVKEPTGAVCELLLLNERKANRWECLAKPGKRLQK